MSRKAFHSRPAESTRSEPHVDAFSSPAFLAANEGLADCFLKGCLVGGVESTELSDNERSFEGGKNWLDRRRLDEAGGLPARTHTSPKVALARSWLVTAITTASGLAAL